jgi:hypothetical protein
MKTPIQTQENSIPLEVKDGWIRLATYGEDWTQGKPFAFHPSTADTILSLWGINVNSAHPKPIPLYFWMPKPDLHAGEIFVLEKRNSGIFGKYRWANLSAGLKSELESIMTLKTLSKTQVLWEGTESEMRKFVPQYPLSVCIIPSARPVPLVTNH